MKTVRCGALLLAIASLACLNGCRRESAKNTLVTIQCEAPDQAAYDVFATISHPLELQLQSLPSVKSVRSASRSGHAVIWIEFASGVAHTEARQLVAERLSAVEQLLPENVETAFTPGALPAEVILLIVLSALETGPADSPEAKAIQLRALAENSLRPRLLTVPGVADVAVVGGLREQIQILVDPERLTAFDITLQEFAAAVQEGLGAKAGETAVLNSTTLAFDAAQHLQAIAILPVGVRGGHSLFVRDLAEARIDGVQPEAPLPPTPSLARGRLHQPEVIAAVRVQADADIEVASREIDSVLEDVRQSLPKNVRIERTVPREFDQLVRQAKEHFERTLPPDVKLDHLRTKKFGNVVRAATPGPVAVKALGQDLQELCAVCRAIESEVNQISGITKVRTAPQPAGPQLEIEIDRERLGVLGLAIDDVATTWSFALHGRAVARLLKENQRVEVVVRLDETTRNDPSQIGRICVRDSAGALIPLDAVTQIRSGTGLSEIFRENGRFLSLVLCDIENRERTETLAEIQKRVSASLGDPPKGVMIEYR